MVLILFNQWLKLTMLWTAQPWSSRHIHACLAINYFKVTFFETFIIWSESVLYLCNFCPDMWLLYVLYLVFGLSFNPFLILAIHCNRRRETLSMPKYSLKGHLQTVCIAVVHLTEIICCNTEITHVLIVFENRIVSSQSKAIAGCDTFLKRNIHTILCYQTQKSRSWFLYYSKRISEKCTTAMHTGWRCPFK